MKLFVGLVMCSALSTFVPLAASADRVSLHSEGGGALLTIQGQTKGLANELFNLLDKAGIQQRHAPEKTDLIGKNLTASAYGFVGGNYTIAIQVDESSSITLGPDDGRDDRVTITLTGDTAQELFDYLLKADLPENPSRYCVRLVGEHLSCAYFSARKYECTFEAVEHPSWWD